jgi:hypothetical protein
LTDLKTFYERRRDGSGGERVDRARPPNENGRFGNLRRALNDETSFFRVGVVRQESIFGEAGKNGVFTPPTIDKYRCLRAEGQEFSSPDRSRLRKSRRFSIRGAENFSLKGVSILRRKRELIFGDVGLDGKSTRFQPAAARQGFIISDIKKTSNP